MKVTGGLLEGTCEAVINQAKEDLQNFDSALASKDFKDLEIQAHKLRGSSTAIGAKRLAQGCQKLMEASANKEPERSAQDRIATCSAIIAEIRRDYDATKTCLKSHYGDDLDKETSLD
ncbi:Hpt domain-containing protein [Streptomyces sp. HUAS TT7]|uniref:Hpt domain-containing protein n=1 Tax=Streptomyces sp. HUAS TT7 TaxID=3447507 RepID=UPI003F65C180